VGTKDCPPEVRRGRKKKAQDFLKSAQDLDIISDSPDDTDSFIQLCILAGIAAADVICCAKLGLHSQGDNHGEAISLLKKVDEASARHLAVLLGMKTKSGYTHHVAFAVDRKRAQRAATALVETALAT
jgi:dihydropteroate synthase